MDEFQGKRYRILHCDGALDSLEEELKKHASPNLGRSYKAKIRRLRERLADGHPLAKGTFPTEGELPDGSHFKALKKIPIRAYLWLSKKEKNTFYVSHYVYKNYDKLKESDVKKVRDNWEKYEGE